MFVPLQLGNGSTSYATSPLRVVGLQDVPIADISAGGWHSLALSTTGGACRLLCLLGHIHSPIT